MSKLSSVPIFDSLTHPMPDGNWMYPSYDGVNSKEKLLAEMVGSNISWALAVGMGPKIGSYREELYPGYIGIDNKKLFPVAYIQVSDFLDKGEECILQYLTNLVKLGFIGIKLHPRFAKFVFNDDVIVKIISIASVLKLAVLLCTYCWERSSRASHNTSSAVMDLLSKLESHVKVILVHGGGVNLLEFMEIARAYQNVLLDLSLTLCKYPGSSLDMDIRFVFNYFDRRICIGSDGPEFKSEQLRERFNYFGEGVAFDKLENVAYKNLLSFLPLVEVNTKQEGKK